MKKVIRLTESELVNLVKRIISEEVGENPVNPENQSKEQFGTKYKTGDILNLYYELDIPPHYYGQIIPVQVKSIRGGFGSGVQGPASQKNSMELDCVLIENGNGDNVLPKLKKGDSVTLIITNVNSPMLAYWKLFKGGTPIKAPDKQIVGGKVSNITKK